VRTGAIAFGTVFCVSHVLCHVSRYVVVNCGLFLYWGDFAFL
jgi:hypothetical protein